MSKAHTSYKEYLRHPKFRAIRAAAMKQAGGICQHCLKRPATEVHHLDYPAWGTFDILENLLPVCHECHCIIEGKDN